jgi:AraC-like DNA-binding protein
MATALADPAIVTLHHSSALGAWTYQETRPSALVSAVETIWEIEGYVTNPLSRIFPNGRVDFLLNLGPRQRVVDGPGLSSFDASCLSGVQTGPLLVESGRETHLFGIRLRAEASGRVFGVSMDSLAGRLAELPSVIGRPGASFVSRLRAARSFAARAFIACGWIEDALARSRLSSPSSRPSHVAWVASAIESSGGAASIAGLRESSGVSAKRLAADFRSQVGVTPKFLARLVRFQRAIGLLQAPFASLSDVALAAGYYDQAHLGLDFRELAGLSPREFVATVYPDGTSAVA